MAKANACCPACRSEKTKKHFLGIPDVFHFGPGLVGAILVMGGVIAVVEGIATRPTAADAPADWMIQVVVGGVVAFLAICGLAYKSHVCTDCGTRFNWPPVFVRKLAVTCPGCGTRLKGATADMVGDTAVCRRCKEEFEIQAE